jgi:dTDP-4-amino-4,6-dideoxygalactose transaminase
MIKVPLADLDFDKLEEQAVLEVLRSRWLTMGAVTQNFEHEFCSFTGTKYAFAVSNATVALHLACLALGIGPGDEVIVPSLTFVATANSVLYTGATIRFVDILGRKELNIDPKCIQDMISSKTKAVIVVHYGGYPCQMETILQIAQERNILVIEDAAHAPGAKINGKHLGTWGIVGCFSFFSNKNLATGEGGMIVTDNDEVAEKVRLMRSHGMTSLTWDRHQGHAHTYDVVELGYNYRIDEIRSAIGRVQLSKLERNNQKRKLITNKIRENLKGCGIEFPFEHYEEKKNIISAYHILPILLPERTNRAAFMDNMRIFGVQTSIHYPPIHRFQFYQERGYSRGATLPITDEVGIREVTLPLFPGMTDDQIEIVCDAVAKSVDLLL